MYPSASWTPRPKAKYQMILLSLKKIKYSIICSKIKNEARVVRSFAFKKFAIQLLQNLL